jgi:aryl-alcohol dehydrogenase-like predicted oxidoreductase
VTGTTLGRTGLEVGRVGLGTMNFGGRCDGDEAFRILDRAVERGVTLIDTANVYGHDPADFMVGRGRSEEIIGRWLADRAHRHLVIATKVYFPMHEGPGALGLSRRNIVRECEGSLRRLGVDAIDLFQLHHPSNDIPIDETLGALDDLVRAGKVLHVGTSSFAAWQLVESLWASDARRTVRFVTEQPVYNLLDRRIERELGPMARTYDIALLTWSPLAGGALTDAYRRGQPAPPGSRFATLWRGHDRNLTPPVHRAVGRVRAIATGLGVSAAALAHAWVASRPEPTCVLVGPRTVAHLDEALDGVAIELDSATLEALDMVAPPGRCILPQHGHDGMAWVTWGPHRRRWR